MKVYFPDVYKKIKDCKKGLKRKTDANAIDFYFSYLSSIGQRNQVQNYLLITTLLHITKKLNDSKGMSPAIVNSNLEDLFSRNLVYEGLDANFNSDLSTPFKKRLKYLVYFNLDIDTLLARARIERTHFSTIKETTEEEIIKRYNDQILPTESELPNSIVRIIKKESELDLIQKEIIQLI